MMSIAGLLYRASRSLPRGALAAALLAAGISTGCGQRPNVLLITMDTTRADRLGLYGYERAETPAIDGVGEEAIVFERCFSPVPLTLPAHSSLMTGLYPPRHGVRANGAVVAPEAETLAEILRREGYATGAAVGAFVLDSQFGLGQGFDHYDDETQPRQRRFFYTERHAELVTDAALAWWNKQSTRPVFLWVHYFDPHAPYEPPGFDATFSHRHAYDAEISFVDQQVKRLVEAFDTSETMVILTADHGEALGEHGEASHGLFVYNATLRVPLIVRFPDRRHAGQRISTPVSLVDVLPSLMSWIDLPIPPNLDGVPLPLEEGAAGRPIYFENDHLPSRFGWSRLDGVLDGDVKFIRAPRPELYDLAADRYEEHNLYAEADPTT